MIALFLLTGPVALATDTPLEVEFAPVRIVAEPLRPPTSLTGELPDRMAVEAELMGHGLHLSDAEIVTGSTAGWRLKKVFGDHMNDTKVELAQQDTLRWSQLDGSPARIEDARASWYGHACADTDARLASLELDVYDGRTDATSSRVVLADGEDRTLVLATLAPGESVTVVEAEGRKRRGSRVLLRRGPNALELQQTKQDVEACYHGRRSF